MENNTDQILANMRASEEENGYGETENIEKIARAKNMMFGLEEWQRCPCEGNNPNRYCGSELCHSDIERDGICHCRCFIKANDQNPEVE